VHPALKIRYKLPRKKATVWILFDPGHSKMGRITEEKASVQGEVSLAFQVVFRKAECQTPEMSASRIKEVGFHEKTISEDKQIDCVVRPVNGGAPLKENPRGTLVPSKTRKLVNRE